MLHDFHSSASDMGISIGFKSELAGSVTRFFALVDAASRVSFHLKNPVNSDRTELRAACLQYIHLYLLGVCSLALLCPRHRWFTQSQGMTIPRSSSRAAALLYAALLLFFVLRFTFPDSFPGKICSKTF